MHATPERIPLSEREGYDMKKNKKIKQRISQGRSDKARKRKAKQHEANARRNRQELTMQFRLAEAPADASNGGMFTPSDQAQIAIREKAEEHLRTTYNPGDYGPGKEANEVIKHLYRFYETELDSTLSRISDHKFMGFTLLQYHISSQIDRAFKRKDLSASDAAHWAERRATLRRAIKYLAERICLKAGDTPTEEHEGARWQLFERAWVCAEKLIELAANSDQAVYMLPKETYVRVHKRDTPLFMEIRVDKVAEGDFDARIRFTAENEAEYADPIWTDDAAIDTHLGPALRGSVGMTYREAIDLLVRLYRAQTDSVPFVQAAHLINTLAEDSGHPASAVAKALSGFAVSKSTMLQEGREARKPKQEYRAFSRGIFEFRIGDEVYYTWSPGMFVENLLQLKKHVIFRRLPSEWRTPEVDKALTAVSDMASQWFEGVCARNLQKLGFGGARSFRRHIGERNGGIAIPAEVGEIDLLAYSHQTNTLLLGECKMTRPGYEPAQFRDDFGSYFTGVKSYRDQLKRKIEWVRSNIDRVCAGLRTLREYGPDVRPVALVCVLITYTPNVVSEFIEEFPVVSLPELMKQYTDAGRWPYSAGAFQLSTS
jgi:hypothetical protein